MAPPTSSGKAPRAWHILGLAVSIAIFSSPTIWTRYRADTPPFPLVTLVFAAVLALIVIGWPRVPKPSVRLDVSAGAIAAALAALLLVGLGLHRWMDAMLWQPLDPSRGDMLVVVQAAIRAALNGHDPYAMYQVPWEAPLPYGPVLWAPFVVPHVLRADLRLITIIGEAFVPICCAATAVVEGARGRLASAGAWLALLAAIVLSPDLVTFTTVGHTPSYWPLIPLFAVFVVAGQWNAAAVVLALLVAGRTTMISIVPMFFIAIWWRSRATLRSAILYFAVPLAVVILPFFLWNPATMWYGMVASYPKVMKGVVWVSSDGGVIRTIGITGWLLAHQLHAYVEVIQVLLLGAIYALAWHFIAHRGAQPLPWMALALFGFSMTTLWPVYYVYFDVLLLFVSGAIAGTLQLTTSSTTIAKVWAAALAATTTAVLAVFMLEASAFPVVDLAEGTSPALYKGFVSAGDDLAGSAAIWGTEASLTIPRRSTSSAEIVMTAQPVIPAGSGPQAITAMLNGVPLATVTAGRGWSTIRLQPPASAWRAGSNRLDLHCASSSVPSEVGLGGESRHLSLAIRRIEVVPR